MATTLPTNPEELRPKGFRLFRWLRRSRKLFSLLWPYARGHKRHLAAGIGLSVAVVLLRAGQPWPLKWIVDSLIGAPSHRGLFPWTEGWPLPGEMVALSVLFILVSVFAGLGEYWQRLTMAGLGNRVLFAFRTALYARVLSQPLGFHERRETGELLTRIVYDTARVRQGVNHILMRIFQTLFTFIVILGILFWLDPMLASIVGVAGVLALTTMGRSSKRIFKASRKQRKREGKLAALVADSLLGVRELHTFRPQGETDPNFERHNKKSLKEEQKVRRLAASLLLRVEILLAIAITLILAFGALGVQAGRLTAGDLVLFVSYVIALNRPFAQFARQTARTGKTFASADRLRKIMGKEPSIADQPDAVAAPEFRGEIVLEGASVKGRSEQSTRKWTLKEVSFRIEPGEHVAVVGHNGAGKSTLLRLLLRLRDPSRGVVRIDGKDIRDYTLDSLRGQFSVVFQDSVFLGMSVYENIAFGRPDATPEEVESAARRCQLHKLIKRLPRGYDTIVRQRGKLFSVGERQRIAIARALLRDGRIWLLDELTAGLDAAGSEELMTLIFEVAQGRSLLCVTHEDGLLPRFDKVIAFDEGKLAFTGTPAQFQQGEVQKGVALAEDAP